MNRLSMGTLPIPIGNRKGILKCRRYLTETHQCCQDIFTGWLVDDNKSAVRSSLGMV
jgi:hypothetical protein